MGTKMIDNADGCMAQEMMMRMAHQIELTAAGLSAGDISLFVDEILKAKDARIYVMGAGRSGLVAKAFAMRLMHLGFSSYVVGETITPAMTAGDRLIVMSGSGKTRTVLDIAETAKQQSGRVCLITASLPSPLGDKADCIVLIPNFRANSADDEITVGTRTVTSNYTLFAPLGTLFETTSLIFCDAIVSVLMGRLAVSAGQMQEHHANIE
ncbi:MAG: 6-phospho-3-hexuloisomerase [Methanomicrobiales archaeon]|jgi:6-phospho-3-hexuloisomerase|nr:6-phospho-3-hexuloisomerase [Methanomicrobiales archaeon]